MANARFGSESGGAMLFFFVLVLFLAVVGGSAWFFTQHPEGRKIAADFLKKYVKDKVAPEPATPLLPSESVAVQQPPAPDPEQIRRQTQADVYSREAGIALDKGNIDLASDWVEKALSLIPNHTEALKLQVEVVRKKSERRLEEERQKRLAAEAAQKTAAAAGAQQAAPVPQKPPVEDLVARAKAFLEAGDLDKAEEFSRKAIDADPADTRAIQILRSVLLARKPQPLTPVEDTSSLRRAKELLSVAQECLANGDLRSAKGFASKAIELDPGDQSARLLLAEINRQKEAEESRGKGQDVLIAEINRLRSEVQAARDAMSRIPVPTQQVDPAAETLRQQLEQKIALLEQAEKKREADNAARAAALATQARSLLAQASYDAASEVAVRALSLAPDNPEIAALVAQIDQARKAALEAEARKTAAATTIRQPVPQPVQAEQPRLAPVVPDPAEKARSLLASARLLAETGSIEAARSTALRALELDPANRDIIAFLASLEKKPPVQVPPPTVQQPRPEPVVTPVVEQPKTEPAPEVFVLPGAGTTQGAAGVTTIGKTTEQPTEVVVAAPPPGTEPDTAVTVIRASLAKKDAQELLGKLDDALVRADVDAYVAMLGADLASVEKANLREFLKEVADVKVTRSPAVSIMPVEGGYSVASEYAIEYRIQNVPVKAEILAQYVFVRNASGAWTIQSVSSRRK